jgi:hypothetical protein
MDLLNLNLIIIMKWLEEVALPSHKIQEVNVSILQFILISCSNHQSSIFVYL